MNEKINITYQGTKVKHIFGGSRVESVYTLEHVKYGRTNRYNIVCDILGLETLDLHFMAIDAEFIGDLGTDSNDETLTPDGAMQLFERYYE